jgi:hypothetical protein
MSVGLGGDGDEIAAIADVEHAFGVKLDYSDAPRWRTAGDVFDSLLKALPDDETGENDVWDRFATALSAETGVDTKKLERASPLLSDSRFWAQVASASAVVWVVVVLGVLSAIAVGALSAR